MLDLTSQKLTVSQVQVGQHKFEIIHCTNLDLIWITLLLDFDTASNREIKLSLLVRGNKGIIINWSHSNDNNNNYKQITSYTMCNV